MPLTTEGNTERETSSVEEMSSTCDLLKWG